MIVSVLTSPELETRELVARYQRGDLAAFEVLFARLAPRLRWYFEAFGGTVAPLDGLVEETFREIHRGRRTYHPASPFDQWLFAIAGHVLDEHRRRSPQPTGPLRPRRRGLLGLWDLLARRQAAMRVRAGLARAVPGDSFTGRGPAHRSCQAA